MIDLRNLNKEQRRAVVHKGGPLLVIAGPGTGKTAVITSRIMYLLEKEGVGSDEFLALTFTEKAAGEMESRVIRESFSGYFDLWISTFHSFCDRMLKENALDIGLPTDFKIIEDTGSRILLRKNLERLNLDYYRPIGSPTRFIGALTDHFARLKDGMITLDEYCKSSKKIKGDEGKKAKELAEAYDEYQRILLENNYLDFGDLINRTIELFKKRPAILEKYKNQFKHLLVDEFQDTNIGQYELIKLLSPRSGNIAVCADGNQAIYRWRGASFGNISRFQKDYPKAAKVVLVKNYRSFQNILDISHKFIQSGISKGSEYAEQLLAHRKGTGLVKHFHFKTVEYELNGIVEKIAEISKKTGSNFGDFAILARSNKEADLMARACERAGMPCHFVALRGLYQKPVILDVISYFNLLDNYHESSAVYRIINFPFLEISSEDIAEITRYGYKHFKSIYSVIKKPSEIPSISLKSKKSLTRIVKLIERHSEMAKRKNVSEIFISFLKDSGYLEYLAKEGVKKDIGYINQFYDRIKKFEDSNIDPRLKPFMNELNLELESGESGKLELDLENAVDAVKVMTVHAAKGLEFKYVFIINLVDRRFPAIEKRDPIRIPEKLKKEFPGEEGDIHLEEERRLFYVAMTRAKNGLFFTSAEDYGGVKGKKISRFLVELGYHSGNPADSESGLPQKRTVKKRKVPIELPTHFSFTQIAAFSRCPLQYKFAHLLKIPVDERPVFIFGKTIHNVLHEFAKLSLEKKTTYKDIERIYKKNWIDEWYESEKQRNEYYASGKEIIKRFYSDFKKKKPRILFVQGRPALEKSFILKIGKYSLKGKIDRIDEIEDGIEVIDYKTGLAKEKLRKDDKIQLGIYQIAAEEIFGLNPVKLTYNYLSEGKTISFLGTREGKEKTKDEVQALIEKIEKSDFEANPGWDCRYCDFKKICEKAEN